MIWIDYKDATPIYEQIVNRFKNLIVSGVLATNDKMPSVRTLAMELSINPNTIQKAYMILEQQGFIYTVKGRGNFVAESGDLKEVKKNELLKKLSDIAAEAGEAGLDMFELVEELKQKPEIADGKEGDK